jgi:hypothetical protein
MRRSVRGIETRVLMVTLLARVPRLRGPGARQPDRLKAEL